MSAAAAARRFLRAHRHGALATLSRSLPGHPYASAVNYVSDARGHPLLLLSGLAEHTRNLLAEPRVSLLVAEEAGDLQAGMRLTVLGTAEPAPASLGARYLRHLPESAGYFRLGDFSLYSIRPLRLRLIGGFGDIRWIRDEDYSAVPWEPGEAEDGMLAEWTRIHSDLLRALCHTHAPDAGQVELIGLDCDGADLRADGRILRVDFAQPVSCAAEAVATLRRLAGTESA